MKIPINLASEPFRKDRAMLAASAGVGVLLVASLGALVMLANADNARKGKQIFLLTDGAFPNNDEVARCIKNRNKSHDVHVFTYLYGDQDDQSAIKLMKDIAIETGGKYKNVME